MESGEEVKDKRVSEYSSSKDKSKERGFNGVGVMTHERKKECNVMMRGFLSSKRRKTREKRSGGTRTSSGSVTHPTCRRRFSLGSSSSLLFNKGGGDGETLSLSIYSNMFSFESSSSSSSSFDFRFHEHGVFPRFRVVLFQL